MFGGEDYSETDAALRILHALTGQSDAELLSHIEEIVALSEEIADSENTGTRDRHAAAIDEYEAKLAVLGGHPQWLPVVGYEGLYEVSRDGQVRSWLRSTTGYLLTRTVEPAGYLAVSLCRNKKARSKRVHRLVLTAFVGPCPEGMETRHLDGDKTNNQLSNLAWGTHSENERDRVAHGTHNNAAKTNCPAGHPYDAENTYLNSRGTRECRTCSRETHRARRGSELAAPRSFDEAVREAMQLPNRALSVVPR